MAALVGLVKRGAGFPELNDEVRISTPELSQPTGRASSPRL